jgi:hypothetical protein
MANNYFDLQLMNSHCANHPEYGGSPNENINLNDPEF